MSFGSFAMKEIPGREQEEALNRELKMKKKREQDEVVIEVLNKVIEEMALSGISARQ